MRSRSLLWSFNYAIEGIVYALRTQRNMRLHLLAAVVALGGAIVFGVTRYEMIALLFSIAFVFVTELMNTAIEATVDVATEGFDPTAKVAKDVAAGAVLLSAVCAVAIGYMVLFDHLMRFVDEGFAFVQHTPVNVTIIALAVVVCAVLVLKAATHSTWLEGGWPSGHVALAVAAATAIGYITRDAAVFLLALFIAGLLAQSRVESETHTILQAFFGAVLGLLISTVIFQVFFA